jgi:hypothetical protein
MAKKTASAKTKKRAIRTYKVWTPADLKALKQYARQMIPVARISRLMKRTQGTIRMKAYQLGFSVGHRQRRRA